MHGDEAMNDRSAQQVQSAIAAVLRDAQGVVFAYVHGSFLSSDTPGDIDVAVYLDQDEFRRLSSDGSPSLDFTIPLEMELETATGFPTDLQLLNEAPLSFRAAVVAGGELVLNRDPLLLADFETITLTEYHDFQPFRRRYREQAGLR